MFRFSCLILTALAVCMAQTPEKPMRSVTDPGVITTRQTITPAGVPAIFDGRVYGVAFGATPDELWVLNARGLYQFDWRSNRVLLRTGSGNAGLQGLTYDTERKRPVWAGADTKRGVWVATVENGAQKELRTGLGQQIAGGLAIAPGRIIAVPLVFNNKLALLRTDGSSEPVLADTGIAPFGAALSADGTTAWVSNWGGRLPKGGDLTAPTGTNPKADRVVIDARGIAATGTVTRVDVATGKATHTIPVELHPTALALDETRGLLYVANSNSDSISVVDTRKNLVTRTIRLKPFEENAPGLAPTALALTKDGSTLYATLGGVNAIAVIQPSIGKVQGLIPTAWYPSSLALSPNGTKIAVGTLLGTGSGWRDAPAKRYVHTNRGAVAVIDLPDAAQLASYSTAVARNSHLTLAGTAGVRSASTAKAVPKAIPVRAGDPSPIEHVVYIIKENRTYDQLFGDLEKGNGDPSLVMFGADVTPNQRALANQFVLLDNFYATGGNSGDGHQWVTQANEVAYAMWPGWAGRSYPYDGTDPIAYSANGFIWDAALKLKKTVRVYGEYAPSLSEAERPKRAQYLERWKRGESFSSEFNVSSPIPPLNSVLAKNYPTYTNLVPDVVRASIFLEDLTKWEAPGGSMPNLTIIQLPCDHTMGTTPNVSTPKAMVADNDFAVGQIVERLSKSRYWPKMAIFIVEDDAQNGVDHVDGHRTVALAISPYARRGHIDSTFYSHQSMVKTIELILGLPTLSLFDLIANDMRASFTDTPDLSGFTAIRPRQSLDEINPPLRALQGEARRAAEQSARMRWNVPDAAPTDRVNRILWGAIRGWSTPYPGVRQSVFAPLSLDIDDDDRR